MMSDNGAANDVSSGGVGVPHIKKELEGTFSECSPSNSDMYSPTTTVMHDQGVSICVDVDVDVVRAKLDRNEMIPSPQIEFSDGPNHYESKIQSPGSPDRQYCSSTTQPHTDSGIGQVEVGINDIRSYGTHSNTVKMGLIL